jgi:serine protease AprX
MARITINGNSFDPDTAVRSAMLPASATESRYLLVQTRAPLTRRQRDELAARGVRGLEDVPEGTYVASHSVRDLAAIRSLPYVAWCDVYLRGFKLAPSLSSVPASPKVRTFGEMDAPTRRSLARTPRTVDVVFHVGVVPESVRDRIAQAARLDPRGLELGRRKVRLTVEQRFLSDLVAIDEVRHIEEAPVYKLHNNVARVVLGLDPSSAGGASGSGGSSTYQGDGQVIGIADTGFDQGSTTNVHPAFTGRVSRLYALGRQNDASDPNGHGTHVAGSALGDGASSVLGLRIRGTAPRAELVLQSVLDANGKLGGLPADLHDLFGPPYENDHVRLHSNSWGSTVGNGAYNSNSEELDDFVWNHRDCLVCFSAGNEGTDANADGAIDPNSITPPGTARNCVTIGATENDRPDQTLTYGQGWPQDFPAPPIATDRVADNPEGMAAFSSRGPVAASRVKPDLVAPGTFVLSTRSRATNDVGWGKTDDPLFFFDGGTSMATPLVAGCAALVREYLAQERQITSPSAALVKAILINGAVPIAGQYAPPEVGNPPDPSGGFGRVNMPTTVGPFDAGTVLVLKDESHSLDTGQRRWYTIPVRPGHTLLKVTLVWTDAPGETLQNDLDLAVIASGGEERHGNGAGPGTFDRANNVEQVIWPNPPNGRALIRVIAFRVTRSTQPYALVIRSQ